MQILCFQDVIDRMNAFLGGNALAASVAEIRQCIIDGYNEFTQLRGWQYYNWTERVNLLAPATGTCQFDGTYFVIDSGSWPSWAAGAVVWIANVAYRIKTRYSDTQLLPDPTFTPAATIADNTPFTIYKNSYTLPAEFVTLSDPLNESTPIWTLYRPYEDMVRLDRYQTQAAGRPFYWSIGPDPYLLGRSAVIVFPHPDANYTLDIPGKKYAREIAVTGYDAGDRAGTVSVSSGVVTGSGTSFTQRHVGAVMRIASNAQVATGNGGVNPYTYQARVQSVASSSSLTLDDATITGVSGAGYVLTDPLDIGPYMQNAVLDSCRFKLAVSKSLSTLKNVSDAFARSLEIAKAADGQNQGRRSAYDGGTLPYRRLARMPYVG